MAEVDREGLGDFRGRMDVARRERLDAVGRRYAQEWLAFEPKLRTSIIEVHGARAERSGTAAPGRVEYQETPRMMR